MDSCSTNPVTGIVFQLGAVDQRRQAFGSVLKDYDEHDSGELTPEQLQRLHGDLRMGGVSLPQVIAAMSYVCIDDTCEQSELYDVLQELDRRYFLVQQLRWEFSMLDHNQTDTISEDQARWLVQAVHGENFSSKQWEQFLMSRLIPGSDVSFAEIEVILCNIPSKLHLDVEEREAKGVLQLNLRGKQDVQRVVEVRKEKEGEVERQKHQQKDETETRWERQLEEEESSQQEEAEQNRKKQEVEDAELSGGLKELEEKQSLDKWRQREIEELPWVLENLAKEEAGKEKEAEEDLKNAQVRKMNTKDIRSMKNTEKDENDAGERETDKKLDNDEMDIVRAKKLLREVTASYSLKRSMSQQKMAELEAAVESVRKYGFEVQLTQEIVAANKMLGRIERMERIRHEILELKQTTVAEIRSYQSPPAIVHTVMTCTLLLLGHSEKETKDWKSVQIIVGKTGKESLKRRCLGCDPGSLNPAATTHVKSLLDKHELDQVRDVSAGAATFYVWSVTVIEEASEVGKQN